MRYEIKVHPAISMRIGRVYIYIYIHAAISGSLACRGCVYVYKSDGGSFNINFSYLVHVDLGLTGSNREVDLFVKGIWDVKG